MSARDEDFRQKTGRVETGRVGAEATDDNKIFVSTPKNVFAKACNRS